MSDCVRVLDPDVGNCERHVDDAHAELEWRLLLRVRVERRDDGRRDGAVQPRHGPPLRVESCFQMLDGDSVEVVVMQVVFARPGDLDRLAVHRFGQHSRLDAVIGLGLPSEAPAEQRDVHSDVLGGHAEPFRDQVARRLGRLEAAPHLTLTLRDTRRRRRRFHGGMGEMRDVVLRLDAARCARHGCAEVSVVAYDLPCLVRRLLELRLVGRGIVVGVRSIVPHDLQRHPGD